MDDLYFNNTFTYILSKLIDLMDIHDEFKDEFILLVNEFKKYQLENKNSIPDDYKLKKMLFNSFLKNILDKIKTKESILPLTPPPDLIPPIESAHTILPPTLFLDDVIPPPIEFEVPITPPKIDFILPPPIGF